MLHRSVLQHFLGHTRLQEYTCCVPKTLVKSLRAHVWYDNVRPGESLCGTTMPRPMLLSCVLTVSIHIFVWNACFKCIKLVIQASTLQGLLTVNFAALYYACNLAVKHCLLGKDTYCIIIVYL